MCDNPWYWNNGKFIMHIIRT